MRQSAQCLGIRRMLSLPPPTTKSTGRAMSEVDDLKLGNDTRSKLIGIYVGVLAMLLAVCGMGGGNAAKDATRSNIEASNMWAFFQAKNIRRTAYTLAAEDLDLSLKTNASLTPDGRKAIEDKIKAYRDRVAELTSDKKSNEGLDEIFKRAKTLEAERDLALRKDPYFDLAEALLQIAIVLASVALLAGANGLLWGSGVLAGFGTVLMLNGFLLWIKLPLLG